MSVLSVCLALVQAGWGHRKTVLAEYMLMLGAGASAILYSAVNDAWRLALLELWGGIYLIFAYSIRVIEKQHVAGERGRL